MALLGDEAIAMGAIHSGISAAYAYPGTPATEIQEAIQKYVAAYPDPKINSAWSINEKVAMEEAVGASLIGKRSLVNMKHVGVNVAADPFMNAAITGCGGGIVIAAADDPSMHSSQNEQDSRYYADFAKIPCFEPSNQQQAYDMTREAFDIAEKYEVPILLRLTTRLAHTRARVSFAKPRGQNELKLPDNFKKWTLLPSNARPQYKKLLQKQKDLIAYSDASAFNELKITKGSKLGIITSGLGYNYLMENIQDGSIECSILRIGVYPLPEKKIKELASSCQEILVIEEGYPYIERYLPSYLMRFGINVSVKGKLDGTLPEQGELTPGIVRAALGMGSLENCESDTSGLVRPRPPALCKGCPHHDTYLALNEALKGKEKERIVFSDIGCYTLGAYPPYETIHSCLCMGASISMAKAAAENGLKYAVAVIGDSTFDHSGITPLLEGIKRENPFTVVIVDNSTTAMTGGQDTICGETALEKLVVGMGIDQKHLRRIIPLPKQHEQNVKVFEEELEYAGPSVIIALRKCIQIK
ncbi:MAG: indolepyruvate ferredoxin oxidoreductase [Deltaproteobacteria bacterium]|nr:indolepyruvate ferredoxin oxidoreductase [Deltaproteobacteria bacterium]